jgi:anthranilate synthase
MVLYLPDEVVVVDNQRGTGNRYRYQFTYQGRNTDELSAQAYSAPDRGPVRPQPESREFAFAERVERAKEAFRRGDLFEVVLTMTFCRPTADRPSTVFSRLRRLNPAPYGALLNLGRGEYLVSGSPEMFVRVSGRRVETCPISGTISRGSDALDDSEQIRTLLNSAKDESELTMCTDVDRNDKARVCVPGSVKVIGRRQIEAYSRVIHTVDHIEGTLREEFDGIDAFLTHMWAVTVTGAPKLWAMRFIEEHEADPRLWYGGAIGYLGFDGNVNTGLTLRTVRIKDGQAQIRAGGTLLYDSVPLDEEEEVRIKAAAFLDALDGETRPRRTAPPAGAEAAPSVAGARILLLDCEDSFVLTLGDYVRQAGAEVRIIRVPLPLDELAGQIERYDPDLLLISPGPGRPSDFRLGEVIGLAADRGLPVFGVCLGLQGIVEYFGGRLDLLAEPVHGKASTIVSRAGRFFDGAPAQFNAGRYHSIFIRRSELPPALTATGWTRDDAVMQVEHTTLPIAAVQFHPESIMSSGGDQGMRLLRIALSRLLSAARHPMAGDDRSR